MGQKAAVRYSSLLSETIKKSISENFHEDPPCPLKQVVNSLRYLCHELFIYSHHGHSLKLLVPDYTFERHGRRSFSYVAMWGLTSSMCYLLIWHRLQLLPPLSRHWRHFYLASTTKNLTNWCRHLCNFCFYRVIFKVWPFQIGFNESLDNRYFTYVFLCSLQLTLLSIKYKIFSLIPSGV